MTELWKAYELGEHERVWRELTQLGSTVCVRAVHEDALTVVRMTMASVAVNVARITERLSSSGYSFVEPASAHVPPSAEVHDEIAALEELGITIPLSLRAFWEVVGTVDWRGSHPEWPLPAWRSDSRKPASTSPHDMFYADPLCIAGPSHQIEEYESWDYNYGHGAIDLVPFALELSGDRNIKANVSGSGECIDVGCGMDALVHGRGEPPRLFIEHLRRAFAWGGFPGFATYDGVSLPMRPRQIEALQVDLLPF